MGPCGFWLDDGVFIAFQWSLCWWVWSSGHIPVKGWVVVCGSPGFSLKICGSGSVLFFEHCDFIFSLFVNSGLQNQENGVGHHRLLSEYSSIVTQLNQKCRLFTCTRYFQRSPPHWLCCWVTVCPHLCGELLVDCVFSLLCKGLIWQKCVSARDVLPLLQLGDWNILANCVVLWGGEGSK
jgi:hypothetical protein